MKIPKKEIASPSPASSSSSPDSPPTPNQTTKVEKDDCWYQLEDGGEIKDLLPAGIIKNSSKLRFDVKEISLSEDL